MKKFIIACIEIYRKWLSPVFPGSCRFYPTCSAYAMEAVERYGALMGSIKATKRILKCHPWHPGGYDPVSREAKTECAGHSTSIKLRAPNLSEKPQREDIPKNLPADSIPANTATAPCALRSAHSK